MIMEAKILKIISSTDFRKTIEVILIKINIPYKREMINHIICTTYVEILEYILMIRLML